MLNKGCKEKCYHTGITQKISYLILLQAEREHTGGRGGVDGVVEAQTGGRKPSLRACCGWAFTQRCQTPSQAPTASPWSGWQGRAASSTLVHSALSLTQHPPLH